MSTLEPSAHPAHPVPPAISPAKVKSASLIAALLITMLGVGAECRLHNPALAISSAMLSALVLTAGRARNAHRPSSRLRRWGKDHVMVESLDDWMIYQHNLTFEQASPAQQSEALDHYKVGLRLFPARSPQTPIRYNTLDFAMSVIVLFNLATLWEFIPGFWYRVLVYLAYVVTVILCWQLAGRSSADPAPTLNLS